jgi:antitoxin VapB
VRLFRNGRNQAVRIPVEYELPGNQALIHREGTRLIIEPVQRRSMAEILDTLETLDETLPEIRDVPATPEDICDALAVSSRYQYYFGSCQKPARQLRKTTSSYPE